MPDKIHISFLIFLCLTGIFFLLFYPARAQSPDAEKHAQEALRAIEKNPYMNRALKEVEKLKPAIERACKEGMIMLGRKEESEQENTIEAGCKEKYVLFISSSIPKDTLHSYALYSAFLRQKSICVSFVLRGFVGGVGFLTPTIRWYLSFALEEPESPPSRSNRPLVYVNVDPEAALKADVRKVPALWDPQSGCVIYGDADLPYLIDAIRKGRCGETVGQTYAFAEENALRQIEQMFAEVDLKAFEEQEKQKLSSLLKEKYTHFACTGIKSAAETRSYSVVPTYTLEFDIPDPEHPGKVLYPKGFTYNVLEYAAFDGSFLIVNVARKKELKALPALIKQAKKPVRILLAGGNYIKIAKRYADRNDVFVYASCRAIEKLINLYHVCTGGTPCLVWAEGKVFKVKEIRPAELFHTQSLP